MTARTFGAVLITCIVAALSSTAIVVHADVFGFVLPGVVVAALITRAGLTRWHWWSALGLALVVVLGWSELVNLVCGVNVGPAARSSVIASGCSALAVVMSTSSLPASFLLPVGGIVAGALLLGAGGAVRPIAVAVAICGAIAMALVESSRRRWVRAPQLSMGAVAIVVFMVGAASLAVVVQADHDARSPARHVTSSTAPAVTSVIGDPFPTPAADHQRPASSAAGLPAPRSTHRSGWITALAGVGGAVIVFLLLAFARLLIVWRRWRMLRCRLEKQPAAASVSSAWVYVRLRLLAGGLPLAPHLSPDVAARGDGLEALPTAITEPLLRLGSLVTPAAFGAEPPSTDTIDKAWTLADDVAVAARRSSSRATRVTLRFSLPPLEIARTRMRTRILRRFVSQLAAAAG